MRCIRDLKFFLAAGIFVMSGIAISADAVEKKVSPSVKISFPYIRQSGIAGNQFAIWVENANGQFIKTLYVTSYTGKGGYAVRKDCVPTWVRRSGAANTPKTELDAVSGATPVSGTLTYTWDCKGKDGKIIAPGKYKIFVEGTLRWKSRVLYNRQYQQSGKTLTRPGAAAVFREIRQSRQYDRNSDGNLHTIS